MLSSALAVRGAYVSRESTIVTLPISNRSLPRSQRTILRILHGVLQKRCCGSSKGQEERAKVGHPFEIGRLYGGVCLSGYRSEKWKQTFHLVHVVCHLLKGHYNPK